MGRYLNDQIWEITSRIQRVINTSTSHITEHNEENGTGRAGSGTWMGHWQSYFQCSHQDDSTRATVTGNEAEQTRLPKLDAADNAADADKERLCSLSGGQPEMGRAGCALARRTTGSMGGGKGSLLYGSTNLEAERAHTEEAEAYGQNTDAATIHGDTAGSSEWQMEVAA
jgi:hypothetical protein